MAKIIYDLPCRICNCPAEVQIFAPYNGTTLAKLLGDFANVSIEENDGKSASICGNCELKLKSSLDFQINVQEAEKRLEKCSEYTSEDEFTLYKVQLPFLPEEEESYEYEFLEEYPNEYNKKHHDINGGKCISAVPQIDKETLEDNMEDSQDMNSLVKSVVDSVKDKGDEHKKIAFELPIKERIAQRLTFEGFEYLEIDGDRCCGCSFIAESREELMRHSKDKHSQNYYADSGYTCPTCYQKFPTEDRLANHINYYSYSDIFLCTICNEAFVLKSHLIDHQNSKHIPQLQEQYIVKKPKVRRRANQAKGMKRPQMRTKETVPHFVCCFVRCWDGFNTEDELLEHVKQVHDGKRRENELACSKQNSTSKHICSVCHRPFENESKLMFHRSYKQKRDEYICLECGKSFHKPSLLRDHEQKEHSALPPQYGCDICGKCFWKQSVLKTHLKIHVPFENVPCREPGCEMVFRDIMLMKRHCRNVHGEMPWQCRFCPKKLRTKEAIDIHERVHTGEKPFSCRQGCDRKFAHATDRVRHERSVHTSEKPHKCYQCNAAYVRRRELKLHLQRCHRIVEH